MKAERKKYLYTPFDGQKILYKTLRSACFTLGLNEGTIRNKFSKLEKEDKPIQHIWQGGKLEWIEVE